MADTASKDSGVDLQAALDRITQLEALVAGMSSGNGNGLLALGQNSPLNKAMMERLQAISTGPERPFSQTDAFGVQRPKFPMGQIPGSQFIAPGGPNLNFTGGSPFEMNPWPTRIANTINAMGRIMEAINARKPPIPGSGKAQTPAPPTWNQG